MKFFINKIHNKRVNTVKLNNSSDYYLNLVELLRLESGKFLYEYPARFRRIFKIIRKK